MLLLNLLFLSLSIISCSNSTSKKPGGSNADTQANRDDSDYSRFLEYKEYEEYKEYLKDRKKKLVKDDDKDASLEEHGGDKAGGGLQDSEEKNDTDKNRVEATEEVPENEGKNDLKIVSFDFSIEATKQCPKEIETGNNIFSPKKQTFTGGLWNNASNADPAADDIAKYDDKIYFSGVMDIEAALSENTTCGQEKTLNGTLLKKYHNWHNGHINGLVFTNGKIEIDKFAGIFFDIKFDLEKSKMMTADELGETYAKLVKSELDLEFSGDELDSKTFVIKITLEEKDVPASEVNTKASFLVKIDPKKYSGEWLRIMIPAKDFSFFSEKNYAPAALVHADLIGTPLSFTRVLVTAETSSSGSLRNFFAGNDSKMANYGDDKVFHPLITKELQKVKEQYIELRHIGVVEN